MWLHAQSWLRTLARPFQLVALPAHAEAEAGVTWKGLTIARGRRQGSFWLTHRNYPAQSIVLDFQKKQGLWWLLQNMPKDTAKDEKTEKQGLSFSSKNSSSPVHSNLSAWSAYQETLRLRAELGVCSTAQPGKNRDLPESACHGVTSCAGTPVQPAIGTNIPTAILLRPF